MLGYYYYYPTITDRQTDGQTDEHRGNSMMIRFNERIAH